MADVPRLLDRHLKIVDFGTTPMGSLGTTAIPHGGSTGRGSPGIPLGGLPVYRLGVSRYTAMGYGGSTESTEGVESVVPVAGLLAPIFSMVAVLHPDFGFRLRLLLAHVCVPFFGFVVLVYG